MARRFLKGEPLRHRVMNLLVDIWWTLRLFIADWADPRNRRSSSKEERT